MPESNFMRSVILVLTVFVGQGLCSSLCTYGSFVQYCAWGCCFDDPDVDLCCDTPVGLIVGLLFGAIGFFAFLVVLIAICRRRRRAATNVTYVQPGAQCAYPTGHVPYQPQPNYGAAQASPYPPSYQQATYERSGYEQTTYPPGQLPSCPPPAYPTKPAGY